MFIKLGLVSGCSEYCKRQSRPCGARGERARDEGKDREQDCVRERERGSERGPLEVDLNPALQCCVSLLLDKVIKHQRVLFLYLFCPESSFKVITLKQLKLLIVKLSI